MFRLGSAHSFARQGPGQQGVLAEVFEVPAAPGLTGQIGAAGQKHVEARAPGLMAHHPAALEGDVGIESGRQGETRWHGRAALPLADLHGIGQAEAGVALLQGGDAETRNARDIAGRTQGLGRQGPEERQGHGAVQQADPFVHGELLVEQSRPLIGIELRIGPGACGLGGGRRGPERQRRHGKAQPRFAR